ncbi:MAG: hypothetical protein XD76_1458 [candidate division TA06 bacterium 32_111]|uniref:ABC transporter permease n=2 Tax=Bacteria candidate phyla TaxID=1783234 RepID=A0A101I0V3_UNCT6|nr:MAG: hypothetical protein XD76_1458 [candidate division TA06 bacterium 32_111]KUK86716.1 MAG: hypothetical protein XE03_1314 [candidate division TA06 bacterium 34_109]HCP17430.1 hypothetical protein [candidate division WOR-3 bacterium]
MKSFIDEFITIFGEFFLLFYNVFKSLKRILKNRKIIILEIFEIINESLGIFLLASLFAGMVAAYQTAYQARNFLPLIYIPTLITQAVVLEIGPLISGIGLSGKVASQISAEIASMKISDQLDALELMSIDPVEYLVMPKVVAAMFIIPFLTIICEFSIVFGSFIISVLTLGLSPNEFLEGTKRSFQFYQLFGGLFKSIVFGLFITMVACFFGMKAKVGAKSVGKATTSSVTVSTISVIILDYLITRILFVW